MTITLIALLAVTLLAMIFLPFSRALMKDRSELHENPMDRKFNILITCINSRLMGGRGDVVRFKDDPRMLNLFDEGQANMLVNFYYSTGSLTITLKYKYFQVELVMKMQFHDMRQAETFRQQDAANHFCEEAVKAIRAHQEEVGRSQGLTGPTGDLQFAPGAPADDQLPGRRLYSSLTPPQKLELLNMARIVFLADGSPLEEFRESAVLRQLLLNLQIDYDTFDRMVATRPTLVDLKRAYGVDLTVQLISLLPVVASGSKNPDARMEAVYDMLGKTGVSREHVDSIIRKLALMNEYFGI